MRTAWRPAHRADVLHLVWCPQVRERGDVKAFGAGILSSFGELEHMGRVRAPRVCGGHMCAPSHRARVTACHAMLLVVKADVLLLVLLLLFVQGAAAVAMFDPFQAQPRMSYRDGYQRLYYALNSFEAGLKLLQNYADSITRSA